jgi:hypothetical protein
MTKQGQDRQRDTGHVRDAGRHTHPTSIRKRNPAPSQVYGALGRLVTAEGTRRVRRSTAASELARGYAEADAIERIKLNLWLSCPDYPSTDLHDWQATHLGEHIWSVKSTWTHPLGGYWYLEWRLDELQRCEKPANQATTVFEDIVRSLCRTLRLW